MALRDQPYLPLYIQDYLTDERLSMCSWATQGVYIKLLCVLHKSDPYGTILLKQNDKQVPDVCLNFASKIMRLMPIEKDVLVSALNELLNEGCLKIEGDKLFQKRMIRDNELSIKRSEAGREGGKKTQFAKANAKAKSEANPEYEDEHEIDYENIVGLYHELCPKMQKVLVLNKTRKGHINARFSEFGLSKITEVLRFAGESDFLNGKNDRAWKADFEWIMRPENFIKILEGKYQNKTVERQLAI